MFFCDHRTGVAQICGLGRPQVFDDFDEFSDCHAAAQVVVDFAGDIDVVGLLDFKEKFEDFEAVDVAGDDLFFEVVGV
ncbi:MAG: hypothetical protein CMB77_07745 [Euryarchaeota archaeon]|nr:hypothetical protein [Euryarchaeota archaeon]MBG18225.1 hypothetical protein [Euryarchaeota archaeon]